MKNTTKRLLRMDKSTVESNLIDVTSPFTCILYFLNTYIRCLRAVQPIKKIIKKILPSKLVKLLVFLKNSRISKVTGAKKKYPKAIQLPITYKCNSRCVMCNIWKMDHSNEMSLDEFAIFMQDLLFKEVNSVGINGGEPSLIKKLA